MDQQEKRSPIGPGPWHYSPSQVVMHARCGECYRRRYVEGEIMPPGIAACRGSAVHAAAESNFRQKLESRLDLPVSDIVEVAAENFRAQVKGGVALNGDDRGLGLRRAIGNGMDETVAFARAHALEQAPNYQPVSVEERIEIPIGIPNRTLLGVLDLTAEGDQLVDTKTRRRAPSRSDAAASIQLTSYAALFKARFGRWPSKIQHDVLVARARGQIERVVVPTTRESSDLRALARRIETMHASIQAGNFVPAPPDSWFCSPRWCGYFTSCKYVNQHDRE